MIIDYSTFRPSMQELKAAGVTAVGRYIGWNPVPGRGNPGHNIDKAEAGALIGSGISVFLSFEYEAAAATKGSPQGNADGVLAREQLTELGAPGDMTVYFAVDFDIPDYAPGSTDPKAKLGPVADYFAAINALHPSYKTGAGARALKFSTVSSPGSPARHCMSYSSMSGVLGTEPMSVGQHKCMGIHRWTRVAF